MFLVALAAAQAMADEPVAACPVLATMIASAWGSFNDAEIAAADKVLHDARDVLACQTDVVPTDTLLEMFRLDGLVALSQADREDAVYATIRAVTIDPEGVPPASYGPQLAELTATWRARLAQRTSTVIAEGADAAWVDGRPVVAGTPMAVVPGEHLVQWRDADGLHSEVDDIAGDHVIHGVPTVVVSDPIDGGLPKDPVHVDRPHVGGGGLLVASSVVAVGGAGMLLFGGSQESDFKKAPWDDDAYGACVRADPCYADARAQAIRAAAGRIRAMYAVGYGLVGLGIGGMGVDLFLLSDSGGIPSGVGVRVPW